MNWKKKYYLDIGIAIAITIMPFCLYLYVPIEQSILYQKYFNPERFKAEEVINFFYYFFQGIVLTLLMSIWFITEINKVASFIFFPLIIFFRIMVVVILQFFLLPIDYSYLITILCILLIYPGLKKLKMKWVKVDIYKRRDNLKSPKKILVTYLEKKRELKKYEFIENSIKNNDDRTDSNTYLKRLFFSRSKLQEKTFFNPINKKWNTTFIIYLLLYPLIFNLVYRNLPDNLNFHWFFMFKENNGFRDGAAFIYIVFKKSSIILLFIIWYVTSVNWYRVCILVPLTIYSSQLNEVLFVSSKKIDEIEYVKSFPFVLIIIGFTIFISIIYKYDLKSYSIRKQLDQEIDRLINKFAKRNSEL